MNIQRVHTPSTRGYVLEIGGRCFYFGAGYDKTRRLGLKHRLFRLTYGFTGSFGIGKAWVFYGTWRTA